MTEYQLPSEDSNQDIARQIAAKDRAVVDNADLRKGGSIHSSPALWENLVIFGSADKNVYALDKHAGKLVWKFLTGDSIASSPFVDNSVVYIGSYDHYIYALRASDGTLIWKFLTGDVIYASPTVADGIVHIGSLDNYHYALRASDGKLLWKFKAKDIFIGSPLVVNNTLLLSPDQNEIYGLEPRTGKLKWTFRLPIMAVGGVIADASGNLLANYTNRKPINTKEKAVACFGNISTTHFFMVDIETGRLLKENMMFRYSPFGASINEGIYYCGSMEQFLSAVDIKNEKVLWQFRTGGIVSTQPSIHKGKVYFGSYDQHLYVLDARDGRLLWKFRTDGIVSCCPVIEGNVIYFGSWDTYLYAIDVEKRELLWRFKTAAPPSKPSFVSTLLSLARIKQNVVRWWKPEAPRIKIYETKPAVQQADGPAAYKTEIGYKSEVGYKSSAPVGYEMRKDKKKDWRDPFRR